MKKPSIFISYSSKDRETAEIIHQQLKSSGFDVWRDKTRLETDWSREIAQALAGSDVLCLLWSEQTAQPMRIKLEHLSKLRLVISGFLQDVKLVSFRLGKLRIAHSVAVVLLWSVRGSHDSTGACSPAKE